MGLPNRHDYRTRRTARLASRTSDGRILRNTVYVGRGNSISSIANRHERKPAGEVEEIAVPPSVDLDLFDRVAARLTERGPSFTRPRIVQERCPLA
jgi:hypothetical protein